MKGGSAREGRATRDEWGNVFLLARGERHGRCNYEPTRSSNLDRVRPLEIGQTFRLSVGGRYILLRQMVTGKNVSIRLANYAS